MSRKENFFPFSRSRLPLPLVHINRKNIFKKTDRIQTSRFVQSKKQKGTIPSVSLAQYRFYTRTHIMYMFFSEYAQQPNDHVGFDFRPHVIVFFFFGDYR